jgi:hypothetical protein
LLKSDVENEQLYYSMIGGLMYLETSTRPNIGYVVGIVSQSLMNPGDKEIDKAADAIHYVYAA